MPVICVNASRSYRIHIGRGLLDRCGALALEAVPACRALLLCDTNVAPLYAARAEAALLEAGYSPVRHVIPAGEEHKTLAALGGVLEAMGAAGLTRSDALFALGGGVTGDIGGFAAAVYQRGVACVQLPTTLLAAVDSSVGGKTAVDLACGKNMAGVFSQPACVICDCDTFSTLGGDMFSCGMAEMIKYGAIMDAELLQVLGDKPRALEGIDAIVSRCCELKRRVVETDERDTGERMLLNFGHTVGHAAERLSAFTLPHGFGVAMGMGVMARAAERLGFAPCGTAEAIASLTRLWALPDECPFSPDDLLTAAWGDKKRSGDAITIIIPRGIGRCERLRVDRAGLGRWIAAGVR